MHASKCCFEHKAMVSNLFPTNPGSKNMDMYREFYYVQTLWEIKSYSFELSINMASWPSSVLSSP